MTPRRKAHPFLHGLVDRARSSLDERGATAVEYGLMVALIAAVIIAVVALLGEEIATGLSDFVESVPW